MTIKKDLYIYRVLNGTKRIKKIKLKKLLEHLNIEVFTKKFFVNEKEAKEYIKNEQSFK
tara:strand:+ start:69 stop:245 length:177 start_codon:yes stop_codon:yes gene_type:complete